MKALKIGAFKLLGTNNYLKLLHIGFQLAYRTKWLKKNYIYKYHYFDRYFIHGGDHVLDIGANLGYYTTLFSKWVVQKGNNGHVYAVEPVTDFFNILRWATRNAKNVTLYNYALGAEEKEVTLETPGRYGYLRTGLAHISPSAGSQEKAEFTFKASMKRASHLFIDLPKLDFIKCDIEGYEEVVLPEMQSVLDKFKPAIQVETWGTHKSTISLFLANLGYEMYGLDGAVLRPIEKLTDKRFGDFIFVHKENQALLDRLGKRYMA